mgnify:CR=1 FL=1
MQVYACPHTVDGTDTLFAIVYDVTDHISAEAQNRRNTYIFFGVSAFLIAALVVLGALLLNSLRKLRAQNKEISEFNTLRQTHIDADSNFIWLKNGELKYVFVNKAAASLHSTEPEELIGCDDFDLVDKELAAHRQAADRKVLEQKTTLVEEVKSGDKVFNIKKFPVKLADGSYGVGGYTKDVTAEYNAKMQEQKTLQRNSILVELLTQEYHSTQEQLEHVLEESLKLTGSQYGYIYVYDEEYQVFELNSWSKGVLADCAVMEPASKQRLGETGFWGEVVRQKKPVIVNDFKAANPAKKGYPQGHIKVSKFMSVPVMMDGKVAAVIGLANKDADYDENDIFQITVLMNGIWNSIERRRRAKELEEVNLALQASKDQLQLLLDSTYEGIYGLDTEGNCTFCNKSCLHLLRYEHHDQLVGKNIHRLIHHRRKDGTPIPVEECKIISSVLQGRGLHVDDAIMWRSDGTHFDAEYFAYPQIKDGEIVGAVVAFMDITERRRSEKEINYLMYHDSLTGLYNRRFFEEELDRTDVAANLPISIIGLW